MDLKILELLKENSRRSYQQIANKIGKTEATVRRRIKKLEKNGVIKKYTTEFSINSKSSIHILVKIEPNLKDIKRILHELDLMEEITDIWRLSGDAGLFLKVKIPSMTQFNPIIEEKIALIKGIKIIEACLILDVIK
ncbi:MAG: Lrp/AsnC family transcriptional regulator [Promethearchaeota archaeon]